MKLRNFLPRSTDPARNITYPVKEASRNIPLLPRNVDAINTASPDSRGRSISAQLESFEFPERTTNDNRQKNRQMPLAAICELITPDL